MLSRPDANSFLKNGWNQTAEQMVERNTFNRGTFANGMLAIDRRKHPELLRVKGFCSSRCLGNGLY